MEIPNNTTYLSQKHDSFRDKLNQNFIIKFLSNSLYHVMHDSKKPKIPKNGNSNLTIEQEIKEKVKTQIS